MLELSHIWHMPLLLYGDMPYLLRNGVCITGRGVYV